MTDVTESQPIPTGDEHYEVRVTRLTVSPPGEALFSEYASQVSIEDEAAGEFVAVTQQSMRENMPNQEVTIEPKEWPALRGAIDYMFGQCRKE